jgi:uncharacterized protein YjgD (DUF1641 family)
MTAQVDAAPSPAVPSELRQVLEALGRVEQRLSRLETCIDTAVAGGKDVVSIVANAVDRRVHEAQARGVDVDARASQLLQLAEKLTEPRVLDALEQTLGLVPELPALAAVAVDSFDQAAGRLRADGVDLDRRLANLARALERASSDPVLALLEATLQRSDRLKRIVESGLLDPSAVSIIAHAGRALALAAAEPRQRVGLFGLLRALGEPQVSSAFGLLVSFARHFGGNLRAEEVTPRLTAPKPQPAIGDSR